MKTVPEEHVNYVVCIDNSGYKASLEKHKIYLAIPDREAEQEGDVRVVDESGEDYLYSQERFVPITVPPSVQRSFALTA